MKTSISTFILLFALPILSAAARLFPCAGYSENGQPQSASETWEIPTGGAAIYLLYRSEGSRELPQSLGIRRRPNDSGGWAEFKNYDRIYNFVANGDDWMAFDFTFKEEGIYECSALDADGKPLATATITVTREQPVELGKVKLAVCRDVTDGGEPVGRANEFSLAAGAGLYALIQSEKAFRSSRIGLEVVRIDEFGYETPAETLIFDCSPTWNFFKMPYRFYESGRYRLKVFIGEKAENVVAENLVRVSIR